MTPAWGVTRAGVPPGESDTQTDTMDPVHSYFYTQEEETIINPEIVPSESQVSKYKAVPVLTLYILPILPIVTIVP